MPILYDKEHVNIDFKSTEDLLSKVKELVYMDKSYMDKRRILRQLSTKDEIRYYLNIMTDEIQKKLNNKIETGELKSYHFIDGMTLYNYIKSFLIDGYLAFEIIFNENKDMILDLVMLDPVTLIVDYQKEGIVSIDGRPYSWIQYPDRDDMRRVLSGDQIIHISYSINKGGYGNTSYVEELINSYNNVKRLEGEMITAKLTASDSLINKSISNAKIILKELKRADKILKFNSMIPKSILEDEETTSSDIRYNNFINRMSKIFEIEIFNRLEKIKNKLD